MHRHGHKIVLGNEFRSDVAVFRLALPNAWQLDPDRPRRPLPRDLRSKRCAVRLACSKISSPTISMATSASRPAMGRNQFIDLYLYDQAAGGAGFVKAAARDPHRLVDAALNLLDSCTCDDSCYQCLRSYKNRYEHALFDRRIGADLLRACFKGVPLHNPCRDREDYALNRLENDLKESGATVIRADGGLI